MMNLPNDITTTIDGNIIAFDGNPTLKQCGAILSYTQEHAELYYKCSQDWLFFAETFYHITSLDQGIIKVKVRDYQKTIISSFIDNRNTVILSSRQAGKSTSYEIFLLWSILFKQNYAVALLANKAETAKGILRKIKLAYELLPNYIKQGVKVWNVGSIILENNSSIIASATSSSAIRSKSINALVLDEFAFVPNQDDFLASVYPVISSSENSKIIIVSTPNGLEMFYKFWNDAINNRNTFTPIRVDWWQVPGRDEQWKIDTIANIGATRFASEYGNDFLNSSYTLIDGHSISTLSYIPPIDIESYTLPYSIPKKFTNKINIYTLPIIDHIYTIGVDSSEMQETSTSDSIIIQIIDITIFPFQQVATVIIREGISYLEVPELAVALAKFYNDAYLFIEANSTGLEIGNIIQSDYTYKNLYQEKPDRPGFKTTKSTKKLGCSNLKMLIENQRLIINDFDTISELSTFIKFRDTYRADKTYKDDCVLALMASIFFMQDKDFDGIVNVDYVNGVLVKKNKPTEYIPIMIFDDGFDDVEEDISWIYN